MAATRGQGAGASTSAPLVSLAASGVGPSTAHGRLALVLLGFTGPSGNECGGVPTAGGLPAAIPGSLFPACAVFVSTGNSKGVTLRGEDVFTQVIGWRVLEMLAFPEPLGLSLAGSSLGFTSWWSNPKLLITAELRYV